MFAANLKQLAIALGGDVTGRRVLCPGPGHTANDRSLQIVIKPDRSGGFSVRSYAGDDWRICRDHVLAAIDGQPLELSESQASRPRGGDLWKRTWLNAKDPLQHIPRAKRRPEQKSPVERYLNSRELELTPLIADDVIRYEPRCVFGSGETKEVLIPFIDGLTIILETGEPSRRAPPHCLECII